MFAFLIKRILNGLLIIWGVISLLFFLFHALPSDPARLLLGQRSDQASENAIRHELGLDLPLWKQYIIYLNDLSPIAFFQHTEVSEPFFFDSDKYGEAFSLIKLSDSDKIYLKAPYLRRSYQSKKPVSTIIAEAFPATALLAVTSMLMAFILGVGLGALCARFQNSWFDRLAITSSVFGMAIPSFFASILIAWIFAWLLGDWTGLPMHGSLTDVDDLGRGEFINFKNIILPAVTLAVRPLAVFIGLSRNAFLDVLSQDYIRTAKAKGASIWRIFTRHALKNAMNPVVTAASGWFASLLAGAVFVEYVFDWKGIGSVIVQSLERFDLPVLMGCLLLIAILFVIINILLDITYRLLDPRIRLNN